MSENEETKEELRGMSEEARLLLHLIDCSKRLVFLLPGEKEVARWLLEEFPKNQIGNRINIVSHD